MPRALRHRGFTVFILLTARLYPTSAAELVALPVLPILFALQNNCPQLTALLLVCWFNAYRQPAPGLPHIVPYNFDAPTCLPRPASFPTCPHLYAPTDMVVKNADVVYSVDDACVGGTAGHLVGAVRCGGSPTPCAYRRMTYRVCNMPIVMQLCCRCPFRLYRAFRCLPSINATGVLYSSPLLLSRLVDCRYCR